MSLTEIVDFSEPLIEGMVHVPPITHRFELSEDQEMELRSIEKNKGFGAFSDIIFMRTYSRVINGKKENFHDTIIRNVNGILSIRKNYYLNHGIYWDEEYWSNFAMNMGRTMLKMQFLPPGRGLYVCGTEFSYQRGGAAFNNCGFVSTANNLLLASVWTMDSLMCGCGIGFDTRFEANTKQNLYRPGCQKCRTNNDVCTDCDTVRYLVHDSREGWVKSLYLLMESYLVEGKKVVKFDYSAIRSKGEPLKGFGGISSGSEPLQILHQRIRLYFDCYFEAQRIDLEASTMNFCHSYSSERICGLMIEFCEKTGMHNAIEKLKIMIKRLNDIPTSLDECLILCGHTPTDPCPPEILKRAVEIQGMDRSTFSEKYRKTYGTTRLVADIFNAIGCCVVAGNIRRSSEIALGIYGDKEFLELKNYNLNPERAAIGWMSNNTVIMEQASDFIGIPDVVEGMKMNGEPGILNLINVQKFGRIGKKNPIGRENEPDKAIGLNPCITGDSIISTAEGHKSVVDLIGKQFSVIVGTEIFESTEKGFWSNGVKSVYTLTLENGFSIKCTDNHMFCVSDDYQWKELKDFDVDNTRIAVEDEGVMRLFKIKSIEYCGEEEVFDCSIPGKNYYIANGILSHNCGEIALESFEYCNLSEIFLPHCHTEHEAVNAAKIATFYASTISLLPTHWSQSNKVISRNRRIGVSLSGIADYHDKHGYTKTTEMFKKLYRIVRGENTRLAVDAGIPESIRVTTVKPSGTISLLAGVSPGIHFPTFEFAIRTVRISADSDLVPKLIAAGIPHEPDFYSGPGTLVFSFPIYQGETRSAQNVSIWEQAMLQMTLQREWSDNATSCSLYFNPETEGPSLERVISQIAPVVKGLSCFPHSDEGVYVQAPYQKIDKDKYFELLSSIKEVQWDDSIIEESNAPRGCDGDRCDLAAYRLSKGK